jgi:hypothetical protein
MGKGFDQHAPLEFGSKTHEAGCGAVNARDG